MTNEPIKLLKAPDKRITLDEYFNLPSISDYVELCTIYVAFANELQNKNIKIVIEKNLAMKIVKGKAPVDALDPLFITLRPEIKDFIKKVISAHIDKIKNDFFKRMQQGSL